MLNRAAIEEQIRTSHSGDERQLEVVFSSAQKLIVEAPAGYGKTKTMISKIAFMISTEQLPKPKKILALTFSVNAAYKVKKDVAEQLPKLLGFDSYNPAKISDMVFVSNYHGFCRHILKRYGYLIHENLRYIDKLTSVDDSKQQPLKDLNIGLSEEEVTLLCNYSQAAREVNKQYMSEAARLYIDVIISKCLPNKYLTFNSILLLAITLLHDFPKVQKFYRSYFPVVIVDEFQDTNYLSWNLLMKLISPEESKAIFIGDPLQRIYGFIGAIEGLMAEAQQKYGMDKIQLNQNYRFKDNTQMLLLDRNIRLNAENPKNPYIEQEAVVPLMILDNQEIEGLWVSAKTKELLAMFPEYKVAIIVKQRGQNIDVIRNELTSQGISYFYAMFSDEDASYMSFHFECAKQFSQFLVRDGRIIKSGLNNLYRNIETAYANNSDPTSSSLLTLLKVFFNRILTEYASFSDEDKILLIKDTFENRALKQNMEHIDASVIVTTVHGAKGLEWNFVVMPDMEQFSFPNHYGLCGKCTHRKHCKFDATGLEKEFLEELSVFYVGVTRARIQVYFSASKKRLDPRGNENPANRSCLLGLPGISSRLISADAAGANQK